MTTDHTILEGCKKGERAAQKALYEQYRTRLYGVCMRYAATREEAEDFLQDAFISIFKDLYQYLPTGSFEGWLRRVTVNACLQNLRRQRRMFSTVDITQVADAYEAEDDFFRKYRSEALVQMLQKLPEGYRAVFNLYVLEDYSHKEISEMLGITEVNCRSHLSRAKAMLRRMLERSMV